MGDFILSLIKYGPIGIIISIVLVSNKLNILNYFLSSEVERQIYTKTQRLYYNIYNLISSVFLFTILVYICSFSITDTNTSVHYIVSFGFAFMYVFITVSFVLHYIRTGKNRELSGKFKSFFAFIEKGIYIFYIIFILLLLKLIFADHLLL